MYVHQVNPLCTMYCRFPRRQQVSVFQLYTNVSVLDASARSKANLIVHQEKRIAEVLEDSDCDDSEHREKAQATTKPTMMANRVREEALGRELYWSSM